MKVYIFCIHIIITHFLLFTDLDPCIDVLCDYHGLDHTMPVVCA